MNKFGSAIRPRWSLMDGAAFLNHGSFGACPRAVQAEAERIRAEMERHPDKFFDERIIPTRDRTELRDAAEAVGAFVGASGDSIALVENATSGTQAVLQSVAFEPGDRILVTDHQYNAVRLAVEARCKETGAEPLVVSIPLRTGPALVRERIRAAAGRRVRLAILDHITSPTAYVFPIRDIIADLHELAIPVHVDGAHAVGQIPLDLTDLQADWYVSNAHKWLYAPKGSAFLYAAPNVAPITRPVVTSHYIELGFPRSFDYVGTRDYSNWLAIPAAIAFWNELGAEAMHARDRALIARATELLADVGAEPIGPSEMCASMRTFVLPQTRGPEANDAKVLNDVLWDEERIQAKALVGFGALLLRVCAQAYVDEADLLRLSDALARRGWLGRE